MAEFDDRVAPWAGAEDVSDVGDGVAEGGAMFLVFDVVAEGAAGPGRLFLEEGLDDGDCFLDWFFERGDWGAGFARFGRRWFVGSEEVGEDFGYLLDIHGCCLAGWVGGMLDRGVLAVASML